MGLRIFLCAPTCRMVDQPQHDDESFNQDNAGTGAEISTENDVPANLHDGPATRGQGATTLRKATRRVYVYDRQMTARKDSPSSFLVLVFFVA